MTRERREARERRRQRQIANDNRLQFEMCRDAVLKSWGPQLAMHPRYRVQARRRAEPASVPLFARALLELEAKRAIETAPAATFAESFTRREAKAEAHWQVERETLKVSA